MDSPPQAPDGAGDSLVRTGVECFCFFVVLEFIVRSRASFFAYVREWVRSLVTFFGGGTLRLVFLASH